MIISEDEGKTWINRILIHEGPSAYSCLTILPDGNIGLLYENGEKSPYEAISFIKLNLLIMLETLVQCMNRIIFMNLAKNPLI